jgi:pimeloyl-ACP methyl ester carboxylesterase
MTEITKNVEKAGQGRSKWRRVFGGLVILLVALMVLGLGYQAIAMHQDRRQTPPPGELVDVGGYQLHIHCVGTGSPTVILEAGLGDNYLTWNLVQEQIAQSSRVCAYDRAGLGWSDPAPQALERSQVAQSLHTLLSNADIQGPYVLVGHSAGGLYVRVFAEQYPQEVAGMVLVDADNENQFSRLPQALVQSTVDSYAGLAQTLSLVRALAPFGVVRIFGLSASFAASDPVFDVLGPEGQQMLIAIYSRTNISQAIKREFETEVLNVRETGSLQKLGDIPLTVLAKSGDDPEGVDAKTIAEGNQIMLDLQQELADLSTNGRLVIVEDTGHYIQIDQPESVITAVKEMVETLQK